MGRGQCQKDSMEERWREQVRGRQRETPASELERETERGVYSQQGQESWGDQLPLRVICACVTRESAPSVAGSTRGEGPPRWGRDLCTGHTGTWAGVGGLGTASPHTGMHEAPTLCMCPSGGWSDGEQLVLK